jgi:radical SAM superfamily enzyme YgiQ (UPF0313 family)
LSHFGVTTQVIEFCGLLSAEEITRAIEWYVGPETFAVGCSTSFWTSSEVPDKVRHVVRHIKDKYPKLKFIVGGARTPKDLSVFDQSFVGESEDSIVTWCQEQVGRKGLSLFNRKFNIVDLDHRFDDRDCILPGEALPIELGRGCVFKCKFCSHHNLGKAKHTYQRQHNLVLDEMRYNYEKFGTTHYLFLDDTVNEDYDKVSRLSRLKDDLGFEVKWIGYLRADLIWAKKESAHLLQDSGLVSCLFGVETFNLEAGRSIDKSWAARHGKEWLPHLYHDLWAEKINVFLSLIAGLPGETYETLEDTVKWCNDQAMGFTNLNPLALYVNREDANVQSEFTRNYSKYGYRNVRLDGYWETDTMNSDGVYQFCQKAKNTFMTTNRISCWGLMGISNLIGRPLQEIMSWKSNVVGPLIWTHGKRFKTQYLDLLRSNANSTL